MSTEQEMFQRICALEQEAIKLKALNAEMLDALKEIVNWFEIGGIEYIIGGRPSAMITARAVIAKSKAKGSRS